MAAGYRKLTREACPRMRHAGLPRGHERLGSEGTNGPFEMMSLIFRTVAG
jgi:hypothetical protein